MRPLKAALSWAALLLMMGFSSITYSVDVPLESFVPEDRWAALGLPNLTEPQRKALAAEFQRVHLEGYASGARSLAASSSPPTPYPPADAAAEDPVSLLAIRSTVENGLAKPYIASTHASRRIAYVVERRKQGIDNSPAIITGELEPSGINALGDASYIAGTLRYPYIYRILSAKFAAAP